MMAWPQSAELAHAWFDALSASDWTRLSALASPGATWWISFRPEPIGLRTMIDRFRDSRAHIFATGPRFTIGAMATDEHGAALEVQTSAVLRDGRVYENTYHFLLEIRDGAVTEVFEYPDTVTAERSLHGSPLISRAPNTPDRPSSRG